MERRVEILNRTWVHADQDVLLAKSVDMVGDMVEDICSRMAVENAAAFVFNDDLEATLEQVLRQVVTARLDDLDQMALLVMQSMADACVRRDDQPMADLIKQLKAETLRQVKGVMPTEVQVLDGLMRVKDQTDRRKQLKELGMKELRDLAVAGNQMVTEMEEAIAIPDVKLLCKLVIVREEVLATMEEEEPGSTRQVRHTSIGVPRTIAGFINNLMTLHDPVRRRMQLFSAIKNACEPPSKAEQSDPDAVLDRIRPGILMTTFYILGTEVDDSMQDGKGRDQVQGKLDELVMDAMVVLDDMSKGK